MAAPVRVLLLWPGTDGAAAGNFGVPQLVLLATYAREKTGAQIVIRDLECERALGAISLPNLLAGDDGRGYDVIALGVYSSFDYLKCHAMAEVARSLYPEAVIVAGGYHASARPDDIVYDGSPYDLCIVGEGEKHLVAIIESVAGGAPLRAKILDSDAMEALDDMPPSDWTYLDRYKHIARKINSQAQVYFSRGCPFDCAFCMERAKREVSWRALSVERAVLEIKSLHEYLDLRTWTVYVADALFGMKVSWRRQFLEALARENIPVEKFWLLIRVDLIEAEDLRLFRDANCGLGFGLESGDPAHLATIRKAGRLDEYLDRMRAISQWARKEQVPWGANVIVGHPGETPGSLERSAAYLRELFLDPQGVTGFLSVDPFRLYPGSPIDSERGVWEGRHGCKFYRSNWWHDGDQEFLAEWVDPSRELTYLERARLQHEHFGPILAAIEQNFIYQGKARDYFVRAIRDQVRQDSPHTRLHYLDRYYAWHRYLGRHTRGESDRAQDLLLRETARTLREEHHAKILAFAQGEGADEAACERIVREVIAAPRERFVPLDRVRESVRDEPVALDASGESTVSALHAYARSFALLDVREGDRIVDLGAGTGFGSYVLSQLVGPTGSVFAVEVDPALAARGQSVLSSLGVQDRVSMRAGDATDMTQWGVPLDTVRKVTLGFALPALPDAWRALPEGCVVIAPLGDPSKQALTRCTLREGQWHLEPLDAVRYVRCRHEVADASHNTSASEKPAVLRERKHLPLAPE
ncbi:MAG: radical SAM protein [Deltaproteobacteria bacterium]|nr:radical SAM protein [Deltaproteobacteria bacterium]